MNKDRPAPPGLDALSRHVNDASILRWATAPAMLLISGVETLESHSDNSSEGENPYQQEGNPRTSGDLIQEK